MVGCVTDGTKTSGTKDVSKVKLTASRQSKETTTIKTTVETTDKTKERSGEKSSTVRKTLKGK